MTASKEARDEKGPSLDDFDKEIEIYQVCGKTHNFVNLFPDGAINCNVLTGSYHNMLRKKTNKQTNKQTNNRFSSVFKYL